MLTVDEARERVLAHVDILDVERCPILEALGRVLWEDVRADNDVPPFDNTAMDGYAVRAADIATATKETPVALRVIGHAPAGHPSEQAVTPGSAIRILTGAPIPRGADTIVPYEFTDGVAFGGWGGARATSAAAQQTEVRVFRALGSGENIRLHGEDQRRGDVILARGTAIRPAEVGVLASLGRTEAEVIRRPRVAIIATGDEVVEIDQPLRPGQIRNSNSYSLAAQVLRYGGVPVRLGIAPDRTDEVRARLQEGKSCDLVLTSGGVSMGDYDVVKQVVADEGELHFWLVDVRPGKPLIFGHVRGVPILGLPGNPVSSMVSFELFARPALLKMQGNFRLRKPELEATAEHAISNRSGRENYLRGIAAQANGRWTARLTGEQGSGILTSMSRANCLVVVPARVTHIAAGEAVRCLMLDWPETE